MTEPEQPSPAVEPATPEVAPTGRPNARLRQTVWDMVRSMALVLGVVAVVVVLAWRPEPDPVKVVDPAPIVTVAVMQADFPVLLPQGLPEGWRPTSARWEPTEKSDGQPVLHIGYVTPSDEYAQVSQSTVDDLAYLGEQTADGVQTGSQAIGDVAWERWETDKRRSLVLRSDGRVLIVSGTGSWEELIALAQSLEPSA